jgi:hypothetical protein
VVIDAGDNAFYSPGNNTPHVRSHCVGVYKRFHICNDQVRDWGIEHRVETVTVNLYAVYNVLCIDDKLIYSADQRKALSYEAHACVNLLLFETFSVVYSE